MTDEAMSALRRRMIEDMTIRIAPKTQQGYMRVIKGKELADHPRLTLATEVNVYFCDPRSPWQRGSNENTNRWLRLSIPRGTDLSLHSHNKLSAIARELNERPQKTLLIRPS